MNKELELEHLKMVQKLVKQPQHILDQINVDKIRMLHPVMGIAGELAELIDYTSEENLLEETGDMLFYIRDLREALPFLGYFDESGCSAVSIITCVGEIVDIAKKICIYGQAWTYSTQDRITEAANDLECAVCARLESLSRFTRDDALEHNLNKLLKSDRARYANGYSDEAAAARVDKESDSV